MSGTASRVLAIATLTLCAVTTRAQFEGTQQPADVLVAVTKFANDLETVREYMGKPVLTLDPFRVDFAAPRHVFYQSQTLFRKVNRLAEEVGGIADESPPPAPEREILPEDVLGVVQQAQSQLDLILESLGIRSSTEMPQRSPRTQSSDVFEEIVHINRQLNLMIDEPFRPVDVRDRLSLVTVYLGRVLAGMGEEPFPSVPFIPNKQPMDVYEKIVECLALNQMIGERIDVEVLEVNPNRMTRETSLLSDNFDLATMLLSDVAFWTAEMEQDEAVFPSDQSSRNVFPSHVFVVASVVSLQLDRLLGRL